MTPRTDDGQRLDVEPGRLLADLLDALWQHLAGTWLVLHTKGGDKRVERRAVERWWSRLSSLSDLDSSVGHPLHKVVRVPRETLDVVPLLRQASGTLAAVGAAHDTGRLDELLGALRTYILDTEGEAGFAHRVARARLKRQRPGRAPVALVEAEARRLLYPLRPSDVNAGIAASRRGVSRPMFRTVRTLAEVPGAEERMGAEMLRQLSLGHRARYTFDDEAQAVRRPAAASCGWLNERADRAAA